MDNIKIRNAADVGWEAYRDLRLQALREEPHAFGSQHSQELKTSSNEWKERLEKYKQADGNWMIFASDGSKSIGMVGAWQSEDDRKNKTVNLMATFVDQSYRGKGVSKLLMNALIGQLKKSGIKKIKLEVSIKQEAAVQLYSNFGFKIVGEESVQLGDGNYYDVYVMEKELE